MFRGEKAMNMFKILDLISWVGIIIAFISLIFSFIKVQTWAVPFATIFGSILYLTGQLLIVINFRIIRQGGRYHFMEYITVKSVFHACLHYFHWIIFLGILVYASVYNYIKKQGLVSHI